MSAEWKLTPTKRRARYYKLIAAGRQQLGVEQSTFARRVDSIASVMQPEGWHVAGMDAASSRFTPSCSSATFAPPGCRSSTRGTRRSGSSWRSPGFSITVVLTLALGIGATVTMLSVLDHVLLRPLIYAHDDRLVALYQKGTEGHERIVSYPTFLDWAHADVGFAGMSFVRGDRLTLATANGPRHVGTAFVSRGFSSSSALPRRLGARSSPKRSVNRGSTRSCSHTTSGFATLPPTRV